jgi:acetoin utilization deacetylase AcuC-like enzyme
MLAYYSSQFVPQLPNGHRFPAQKYRRLYERVRASGIIDPDDMHDAERIAEGDILRVHAADYWDKVRFGTLSEREQRRIGFPWSPQIVERTLRVSGGTLAACRAALCDGVSVNLAGGTHHAHHDFGSGYCILNDSVIAARALQAEGAIRRAVVIDCDVHQGDGTARLAEGDRSLFTFSIHGAKNFPFHKATSDLDIELPDGTEDDEYLLMVEEGVRRTLAAAGADLAIYIAGADPYVGDTLGKMAISMAGLAARDRLVMRLCKAAALPVAVTMGGGYARDVDEIAAIHTETVRAAREIA